MAAVPDKIVSTGHPQRAEGLETHVVADQVAVYDVPADRLHYLNPTAALVLELCDGSHSSLEIAAQVQKAYALPAPPFEEVNNCLADLRTTGLVV